MGDRAIEEVSFQRLRTRYGSPLYVVSEAALRDNMRRFGAAFRSRYPRTAVAYSYKTNYVSGVCAILHQEGAWAEVVSGFELAHALALKVPGRRIVYNGPHKPLGDLLSAVRAGARVNADSLEEVAELEEISRRLRRPVKIGIRVNMRLGDTRWDRFGFNLESGQALDACRRIAAATRLRLSGLHLHAGTYLTDVGIYRDAVEGLLRLARTVEAERLGEIEYFDLGGGFAPKSALSPAEYAEAICAPLVVSLGALRRPPLLLVEPGRALVDDAVTLLASVVAVKAAPAGRRLVVVDGGLHLLPNAHEFPVEVAAVADGPPERADVVGALCMHRDVLRRDAALPPVSRGSILLFHPAGAYTISHSMQFSYPRPPVVLVRGARTYLLRRGERDADLLRLDRWPPHLAAGRRRV